MPLAKARPMRFRPRSLSDTLDAENSVPGACNALINLIQDPSTPACLQCRPAALDISAFSGFSSPGVISVSLQTNDRIYGLIGSALHAGHDQPFIYDLVAEAFISVDGITAANTPSTQATSGDWTPPQTDVVGQRIIVTHPGFLGSSYAFGYFDISNFTETVLGNITTSSNKVTGNPSIGAIGPGYKISGTGIPANTTVLNAVNVTPQSFGTTTSGSPIITSVGSTTDFAIGQPLVAQNIPTGSLITAIGVGTITVSNNATATSSTPVTISATGTVITMSTNASATTSNLSITIAGGTTAAPLWSGANTTNVLLTGIPTSIKQFNNRAYFSLAQFLIFTDPLSLNIAEPTQALVVGDTAPLTALHPLTIINAATAAPVQGLLTFKNQLITLVTGDPTTNNLANSVLSSAGQGTNSPNAVCATNIGVFYIDSDGVRNIELTGNISDPLPDVRVPFINAIAKTRISASYNTGIYRACLQNGAATGTPFQEFWYDLKYKLWTGPHTFRQDIIVPWRASFIAFSNANPATMYRSDPVQNLTSSFVENGDLLAWVYGTSAMGDAGDLTMNSLTVSTINVAFKTGAPSIQCLATDENGTIVGNAMLATPGAPSLWGTLVWGAGLWFGQQSGLQPRQIPWTSPVVFSKLILTLSASSSLGFQISNFQAATQSLGYVSTLIN